MTSIHVIQTADSMAESTGGPARAIRDLSEALARAGAQISVVVAANDDNRDTKAMLPAADLASTIILPKRLGPVRTGDFAATFERLIGAGDRSSTVVHGNGLWNSASATAIFAARRCGLAHVISPHGMLAPWALAWHGRRKRLAWHLFQRRLLAEANGLVANSDLEHYDVTAHVPDVPVAVIPNGVGFSDAIPDRTARDAPQPRTLLFMSRLHPKKNVLGLIEAWAPLAADPRFADWTLRIAGPDEIGHRAQAHAAVERLSLGGRVRIDAAISETDKPAAFADADLFILPSFSENFGIVVAEALAHGVPVIATIGTPWQDLPIRGCGWHVVPDVATLRACLETAMSLPAQARRAMGVAGHAYVRANFGWDGIAARMIEFYERSLLASRGAA